jgi:succinate dehydrogenase/fumarate reductase flavoprotein subunit
MDVTKAPLEAIQKQIPYVHETCLHRGIDITNVPLEVAPGSHTWLGGLKIDMDGRTPVGGLFAAGETAGGIHGGNRLGGSALAGSLVFGRRAVDLAKSEEPRYRVVADRAIPKAERDWLDGLLRRDRGPLRSEVRIVCRTLAHNKLGPIREDKILREALADYQNIEEKDIHEMRLADEARTSQKVRGFELESALSVRNLALLGRLVATAALRRTESRGAHYRLDFPEADDLSWIIVTPPGIGPGRQDRVSHQSHEGACEYGYAP